MKVTVIMSVCSRPDPENAEHGPHPFLTRALDSILKSRYPEGGEVQHDSPAIEILIGVDGCRPLVWNTVVDWAQESSIPLVCHAAGQDNELDIPTTQIHGVVVHMYQFPFRGQWGNPQRDGLLPLATGDMIHLSDHDDAYFPDSLRQTCLLAEQHPGHPIVAKMRIWCHGSHTQPNPVPDVLWKTEGRIEEGHFGGHMLVVPNRQEFLGRFVPHELYAADFRYIKTTLDNFRAHGFEPVWSDGFICSLRPWSAGRDV